MKLDDHQQAMLAGAEGPARRAAMEQIVKVGRFFDADDCVAISQVHLMADPEALGPSGVDYLESLAVMPLAERRVRVPSITDPRGVDFAAYKRLGQTDVDGRSRAPRNGRLRGARRHDDQHLHQLPVGYSAGKGRAHRLRRYRLVDLRQQRARRADELRRRAVGAGGCA